MTHAPSQLSPYPSSHRCAMRAVAALVAAAGLAGCATAPPDTPGAGSGSTYTPVIDMQGLDRTRYTADLNACRQYAFTIDPQQRMLQEGIAGAIAAGAVAAILGGSRGTVDRYAAAGAGGGMGRGLDKAVSKQELIITNCMAGRGYRTLDSQMSVSASSSPYTQPAALPAANFATQVAAPNVAAAAEVAQIQVAAKPATANGAHLFQVERMAEVKACNAAPRAALSAKGPGFESYTVPCANGDALMIRCEFGNCRPLR